MVRAEGEQRPSLRPDLPRIRRLLPNLEYDPNELGLEDPEINRAMEVIMHSGREEWESKDPKRIAQKVRELIQRTSPQEPQRNFFQKLLKI
ncbi:hypothetical protein HYV21_02585 [Candidatus Microgenomates bacterium]|nr:hypothetical protein [Candidatus Microgenomates bacterium]